VFGGVTGSSAALESPPSRLSLRSDPPGKAGTPPGARRSTPGRPGGGCGWLASGRMPT